MIKVSPETRDHKSVQEFTKRSDRNNPRETTEIMELSSVEERSREKTNDK